MRIFKLWFFLGTRKSGSAHGLIFFCMYVIPNKSFTSSCKVWAGIALIWGRCGKLEPSLWSTCFCIFFIGIGVLTIPWMLGNALTSARLSYVITIDKEAGPDSIFLAEKIPPSFSVWLEQCYVLWCIVTSFFSFFGGGSFISGFKIILWWSLKKVWILLLPPKNRRHNTISMAFPRDGGQK